MTDEIAVIVSSDRNPGPAAAGDPGAAPGRAGGPARAGRHGHPAPVRPEARRGGRRHAPLDPRRHDRAGLALSPGGLLGARRQPRARPHGPHVDDGRGGSGRPAQPRPRRRRGAAAHDLVPRPASPRRGRPVPGGDRAPGRAWSWCASRFLAAEDIGRRRGGGTSPTKRPRRGGTR